MSNAIFIPHGGGPLPLMEDQAHLTLNHFLRNLLKTISRPKVIVVVSAHWEENEVVITSNEKPELIYDYYGFPEECYKYKYPAKGSPQLASKLYEVFLKKGIPTKLDSSRGFDHGMFVPLMLMNPNGDIPCIQVSLLKSLDPAEHIRIGSAIASLQNENILLLGSGFSFHNLRAFFSGAPTKEDIKNNEFQNWLHNICTNKNISEIERENNLNNWQKAPNASYCHPREEHLLPLHVCYGFKQNPAESIFFEKVLGKMVCGFLWR